MSTKQKNSIFNFLKWLSAKYIELDKKTISHPFKLSGIVEKSNKKYCKIEFAGQVHSVEIEPETIVDKNIFEYFSAEDKKKIFSLVYKKETMKLSDVYQCKQTNQSIVVLTELSSGNKMTLPAEKLCLNEYLLNQINSKDANTIGHILGAEYMRNMYEKIKDLD